MYMKMDTPTCTRLCYNIVLFAVTSLMCSSIIHFSDASCALPEDLKNTVWEYNYTDVASKLEETTILSIANTTLPDSIISFNANNVKLSNWTCINNLDVSDTTTVVVFKSDTSFPSGGSRWVYICMKLTQVSPDFFYFQLLSGSSATLASNVSLCEPCDSDCEEATTMMTSLETTQITTLPPTATKIDITTDITSTENTQKISKQSTSTEMDITTDVISTETSQITMISSTATEIDTTTEMTTTTTTPETTLQTNSSPTEMECITESTTTAPKPTPPTTSTEIDTTIQLSSTDTTQTTVVHSTVTDSKTTTQTTIPSASTNTETTTELKVTTIYLQDETTLETKSTDMENLKQYSGPIILVGISCSGFAFVIIVFCLLKGTSKIGKEENTKAEQAYDPTPEICYTLYKGKEFGLQKIAIRHWDYH